MFAINIKTLKTLKYIIFKNYIERLIVLNSTVSGCVCSQIKKQCNKCRNLKKYKPKIKKKKKKHNKIVFLGKSKQESKGILISKALIDPNIRHDEFVLINNLLK